jgi:hypothetical protein
MSEVTKYRMTFKCSCGAVFKKLTTNPDLVSPPCPECKKAHKKTKFHRLGDGPVPSSEKHADTKKREHPAPNTIYRCDDCRAVARVFEDVGETLLNDCPSCGSANIIYRGKISHDIPTGSITKNRCVDKTADIVMTDYGMTNLKDNVRVGENMAPKLAPHLQGAADNMFGGKSRNMKLDTAKLARRAMSGAMRDPKSYVDPVAALHKGESRGRA